MRTFHDHRIAIEEMFDENIKPYVVKLKVFDQEILSQGDEIEVLEPGRFREEIAEVVQKMRNKYKS